MRIHCCPYVPNTPDASYFLVVLVSGVETNIVYNEKSVIAVFLRLWSISKHSFIRLWHSLLHATYIGLMVVTLRNQFCLKYLRGVLMGKT